jgi:hypothetical protein
MPQACGTGIDARIAAVRVSITNTRPSPKSETKARVWSMLSPIDSGKPTEIWLVTIPVLRSAIERSDPIPKRYG